MSVCSKFYSASSIYQVLLFDGYKLVFFYTQIVQSRHIIAHEFCVYFLYEQC